MPTEVEDGYLQLPNDFCGMSEDYLSGIEFAQSITNLDYGLSDGLHISASESPIPGSSADTVTTSRSDLLAINEVPQCQNDQLNLCNSGLSDICSLRDCATSFNEKPLQFPTSCTSQNIGKSLDIPSHSPREMSSDEYGGSLFPSGFTSEEMFCSSTIQENNEFRQMDQDVDSNSFHGKDALAKITASASSIDAFPTQKRSRKPTRRYITEVAHPVSRCSKKRQVSTSVTNDKPLVVKNRKKNHMESKRTKLSVEESSCIAIQVPFGSLVHDECQKSDSQNMVLSSDNEIAMAESEDIYFTAVSQKKRCGHAIAACQKKTNDSVTAMNQKKGDDFVSLVTQKKRDNIASVAHQKKKDRQVTAVSQKKRDKCVRTVSHTVSQRKRRDDSVAATHQKKRNDRATAASRKRRDNCDAAVSPKKWDDCITEAGSEGVSMRRKHHRLWTISEVGKLIDGVAQYGVGRWSRIKKLFFSNSPHRTSVDLKDKWRNLLKASGIQEQGKKQGEKKRNMAWRPLPKSILCRVCELATLYPYPSGHKLKTIHQVAPDRSTDITLSDYRRILRSINCN